ncbi:MAG: HesA/MoeB/ThiF family protein, partial [Pseudomonadales bacterium]|nr:HesA/MoeB/ThiF family protein [Pseudomonadales bacterium]
MRAIDDRRHSGKRMGVELSDSDKRRYARHLILPEVGIVGQAKLRDSSVCVIGAGGLGSPVLMYLAAAGVGRIGIVDDDEVDESNLQRQVVHSSAQIGLSKVASAKARLESLNPSICIEPHITRLSTENAFDIIGGYDLVIDGSDNLPTRYLINDACEILAVPWV